MNKDNLESVPMSESSRLPLGLGDSQGGIIGRGSHSYSFGPAKGHKTK